MGTSAAKASLMQPGLWPGMTTDDESSGIRVGHVHLRVSNLDRSLAFYRDVIGLDVFARADPFVFLGADGYHHHVALNTVQSEGGQSPPDGSTGLDHLAFLYPTEAALRAAVYRVRENEVEIESLWDHGMSLSAYLSDPDGNGVELCWDFPRERWPRTAEEYYAAATQLDLDAFLEQR